MKRMKRRRIIKRRGRGRGRMIRRGALDLAEATVRPVGRERHREV
jgi:hypothetical protein